MEVFEGGRVYLDSTNQFKTILGGGSIRSASMCSLCSFGFISRYSRAGKKYPDMKSQMNSTNGMNLGGVLVVASSGEVVIANQEGVRLTMFRMFSMLFERP